MQKYTAEHFFVGVQEVFDARLRRAEYVPSGQLLDTDVLPGQYSPAVQRVSTAHRNARLAEG
jgi:hypothetical protein